MGLLLQCAYNNLENSRRYTVEVYDDEHSGDAIDFDMQGGVVYTFEGVSRNAYKWIMPTTASLVMDVAKEGQLDFIRALQVSDEGRFWLKILKDGVVDFIGDIAIDQSSYPDVGLATGISFSIGAVDGLARLKDVPYEVAASQNFINQQQDGRFRVAPTAGLFYPDIHSSRESTSPHRDFDNVRPWFFIEEDHGGGFDTTSRSFKGVGRFHIKAFVSIFGDITAYVAEYGDRLLEFSNGLPIQQVLFKIDVNGDTIILDDQELLFHFYDEEADTVTSARVTASIDLEGVELREGEELILEYVWQHFPALRIEERGAADFHFETISYFESIVDGSVSIDVVHASVLEHISHMLRQLPRYGSYDSDHPLLGVFMPHVEDNQGDMRGEVYTGLPYNAFVTDFTTSPATVLSVYDSLIEICKLFSGQLSYRSGQYLLYPFHAPNQFHLYSRDFEYIGFEEKPFSSFPMQCVGTHSISYLAGLRSYQLCFTRLSTLNILSGVGSYFPMVDAAETHVTDDVIIDAVPYRLDIVIRITAILKHGQLLAVEEDGYRWRHGFKAILKAGNDYITAVNINEQKQGDAIYAPTSINSGNGDIDIHGPIQDEFKEHVIEVSFELPVFAYEGPLELNVRYDRTYVVEEPEVFTELQIPEPALDWSLDVLRLSPVGADDPDGVFSQTICTKVCNDSNSQDINHSIVFSDLAEIGSDGGGVLVWSGGDWVRPAAYGGRSLQMAATQWLSNQRVIPAELRTGSYIRVFDYGLAHATDSLEDLYLMMGGSYDTKMSTLSGTWIRYQSSALFGRLLSRTDLVSSIDNRSADAVNDITGSGRDISAQTGSQDGNGIRPEYQHFTDEESTDRIAFCLIQSCTRRLS